MHTETPQLAIPVFRSRVAPVLNWCSKMLILGEGATAGAAGQEILLLNMSAFDRLRIIRDEGISTVICGALSGDLLIYGENLGLHIICGVAGDIDEVLQAYQARQLDQPRFRLPGSTGPHSAGRPTPVAQLNLEEGLRIEPSRNRAVGIYTCPRCGLKVRHPRGLTMTPLHCPQCDLPMIRT